VPKEALPRSVECEVRTAVRQRAVPQLDPMVEWRPLVQCVVPTAARQRAVPRWDLMAESLRPVRCVVLTVVWPPVASWLDRQARRPDSRV
jgi:hypothetical protein